MMSLRTLLVAFMLGTGAIAPAFATAEPELQVFVIANQADDYGVDRCLAEGARCGQPIATAFCKQNDFQRAVRFARYEDVRVEHNAIVHTGSAGCRGGICPPRVAIVCER